jgi:uncharacterized protein
MAQNGQEEIIAFLSNPASYSPAPDRVELMETHGALIFLAGHAAFKIKRAVRFDYMDFSTVELRHRTCLRELEINKPHAPEIYLDVVPITCEVGKQFQINGRGEPVEWVLRMRRFSQSDLMSTIADKGLLEAQLCRLLADAVVAYHRGSPSVEVSDAGVRLGAIADSIAVELARHEPHIASLDASSLRDGVRRQIERLGLLLVKRDGEGYVRRCHGDLHLGNIVLWKAAPVLFDAIEFDEAIATIDTLYDLAFLLMDLDHRGQLTAANAVLNRYLWSCQDVAQLDGLAAMPLFCALRAGIRAMVLAQRAAQEEGGSRIADRVRAQSYLTHAKSYLRPAEPFMVAVGGLSGTGKSTLAAALAQHVGQVPGAVHLRSDLERKALFKHAELDRLPPEAYSIDASAEVYAILLDKAAKVLAAGHGVIVDAVFIAPEERAAIEHCAKRLQVQFLGIWLEAPQPVMRDRVAQRRNDASDATVDVVDQQLARDAGQISWARIAAGGSREASLQRAISLLPAES